MKTVNGPRTGIVVLALMLILFVAPAAAQSQSGQLYWHSSDYYSIQFDGAGNAFMDVEMNLQSLSSTPVNTVSIFIPYQGVTVYRILGANGSYGYYGGGVHGCQVLAL